MASTLRYKPVALLAVEFYNKNGNFTEETTTGYQRLLKFCESSRKNHLTRHTKDIRGAAADYHKSIVTHNPALRLQAHEKAWQANAHMSVVRMRDSEIDFIEEKLRNNT